jgi:hypothetical protein
MLGPIGLLITAVALLAAYIYSNWDTIGPVLARLRDQFMATFGPHLRTLFNSFMSMLGSVAAFVGAVFRLIGRVFTWFANTPIARFVVAVLGKLGQFAMWLARLLGPAILPILSAFVQLLSGAFGVIGGIFDALTAILNGDFAGAWQALRGIVTSAISALLGILRTLIPGFDRVVAGIGSGLQRLRTFFIGIMVWFASLPIRFFHFGRNMLQGLLDGIGSMLASVRDRIVNVGSSVAGWFAQTLGIRSPSRVFMSHGGFLMQGLARGVERGAREPLDRVLGVARRLSAAAAMGAAAPAMAAGGGAGSQGGGHAPAAAAAPAPMHVEIHLHGIAGNPQDIEAAVRRAVADAMRQASGRSNASYRDD